MKKGFATTGILYTILIICLTLIVSFLVDLQNKKSVLDSIKSQTVEAVDNKAECSYAEDEINSWKKKYNSLKDIYDDLMKQLALTDADKNEILDGKKAYSKGNLITGIMPNNGSLITTLKAGNSYTIKEGYYSGGTVTAETLANQTLASATEKQILEGYTAWVNGIKLTGTDKGYDKGYSDGNKDGYDEAYNNAKVGTAVQSDVLAGKTFTSSTGVGLTGTMKNNGRLTSTLNAGNSYTIPAGYTSGGTVTANSLASQTPGNLAAYYLPSGYYGWSNGVRVDGNNGWGNDVYNSGYNNGYSAGRNSVSVKSASVSLAYNDNEAGSDTKTINIGTGRSIYFVGTTVMETAGNTGGRGSGRITYSYNSGNGNITITYSSGDGWTYTRASTTVTVIYS